MATPLHAFCLARRLKDEEHRHKLQNFEKTFAQLQAKFDEMMQNFNCRTDLSGGARTEVQAATGRDRSVFEMAVSFIYLSRARCPGSTMKK